MCKKVMTLIGFALLCGSALVVQATTIDVPGDQPTIQAGIDAAGSFSSDTVLVAPGTYVENINFKGKYIVLTSHYALSDDPVDIFNTVIDGSSPTHPDTASVVLFINNEANDAVLQGFTITGGTGTVWEDEHGAGTYREGGGILCTFSSPTIQCNYIVDNEAIATGSGLVSSGGGGMRIGDGNPIVRNNIIVNNRGRYGAGIVLNYAQGTIYNNIIAYNTGGEDYGGAGIWKWRGTTAEVVNNTIIGNTSSLSGGGVHVWAATMNLRNNIIWGNDAPSGPQIKVSNFTTISGVANVTYSDVQGGWTGTGNSNFDPEFLGQYFYLASTSPCIDAGNPDGSFDDIENPSNPGNALWPAMGTVSNDMGAYGGPGGKTFELLALFADQAFGWKPLTVSFDAQTALSALSWSWAFGDGGTAGVQTTSHEYITTGIFDVSVEIDTGGGTVLLSKPGLITVVADTLRTGIVEGTDGESVEIVVTVRNEVPLVGMILPIEISGDLYLTYDSISTTGCRTDYFEEKNILFNENKQLAVELVSSLAETSPQLAPGDGPVLKVYATIDVAQSSGTETPLSMAGWSDDFRPSFQTSTLAYEPGLVSGTVALSYICGDADNNGTHNVADPVYTINHIFKGGPAPVNLEAADANCDGQFNISDAVHSINFIFKGGPPPCCP